MWTIALEDACPAVRREAGAEERELEQVRNRFGRNSIDVSWGFDNSEVPSNAMPLVLYRQPEFFPFNSAQF